MRSSGINIQKNFPKENFFAVKNCEFCSYKWHSRVARPVSCPRCKRRFDYKEAKLVLRELSREFGYDLIKKNSSKENFFVDNELGR